MPSTWRFSRCLHGLSLSLFHLWPFQAPKSGEVWCEGGRLHMNPTSPHFNLKRAHKFLNFAIEFTPQYGDAFIESLRLKLLLNVKTKTGSLCLV